MLRWTPPILIVAGVVLGYYLANRLSMPVLADVGWVLLSLGVILAGVRFIVEREAEFTPSGDSRSTEMYFGWAARLWGILFTLIGIVLVVVYFDKWLLPGGGKAFVAQALRTTIGWAVLLISGGVIGMIYGIIRLLSGSAELFESGRYARLHDLYWQFVGGLVFLIGLGLTVLGLVLIISPETILALIKPFLQPPS